MEKLKTIFKKITSNFMLYYFILVLIVFTPKALTLPSLSFRSAIVTAVGIDKEEDKVLMSVATLSQVNQGDNKENNKLISAKSDTVASAIKTLEVRLGRKIQLGHVKFVLVSEDIAKDDIADFVDLFVRTSKISNSVALVICKDSAKDLLDAANTLSDSSSYNLSEIISNDYNNSFIKGTSIDFFFKGYFSPIKISSLGYVELSKDESAGISAESQSGSSSGGESGGMGESPSGGQSGGGGEQKPKVIAFDRKNVVLKNGKIVKVLSEEEMEGLNWITAEGTHQYVTLENFTDKEQGLQDATISIEVIKKNVQQKVSFFGDIPNIYYEIKMDMSILEVIQKNDDISNVDIKMTNKMRNAITDKVKEQLSKTLNSLKAENLDIIGAYQMLNALENKKFHRFLGGLKSEADFLKYIRFQVEMSPKFV